GHGQRGGTRLAPAYECGDAKSDCGGHAKRHLSEHKSILEANSTENIPHILKTRLRPEVIPFNGHRQRQSQVPTARGPWPEHRDRGLSPGRTCTRHSPSRGPDCKE